VRCSVLVFDPAVGALRLVGQRGLDAPGTGGLDDGLDDGSNDGVGRRIVPLDDSLSGWVFRSGSPGLVADVRDGSAPRWFRAATTRSELAVPILLAGRPAGVLGVESGRVASFGIHDVDELTAHAARAAVGLERLGRRGP